MHIATNKANTPHPFASVIKSSVQTALQEACVKKDVVITIPENNRDLADIETLCDKVQAHVKPTSVTRLGKPKTNQTRPRPLKASFPTQFDARAFIAKIESSRKETNDETFAKIKCRPCRTREEQVVYAARSKEVHKLNEGARSEDKESFSLRNNGDVWKYTKSSEGRWNREPNWTFNSPADTSENKH